MEKEQVEKDIQTINKMETSLFQSMHNDELTDEQYENTKNKIKELMNMRIRLHRLLEDINQAHIIQFGSSADTLAKQQLAMDIIQKEMDKSSHKLQALEDERNKKVRLVELNEYYEERYEEHITFVKIVIVMLVVLIFIGVVNKTGILPTSVYYGCISIVAAIGAYYMWKTILSIMMRDPMVYSEYKWNFNASSAPTVGENADLENDPWALPEINTTCIGSACCAEDQEYDYTTNRCKYSDNNVEAFRHIMQ